VMVPAGRFTIPPRLTCCARLGAAIT